MLIQMAAVMVALLGMLGLGVDFGFVILERRHLQNAVDAAALTGAIDLVGSTATTNASVNTMAGQNDVATGVGGRTLSCQFVNSSNTDTGPCSSTPSSDADGVHVTATRLRDTYFMRALGIQTVTIQADSIARISLWRQYNAGEAPFIVCGFDTYLYGGGTLSILTGPLNGPWGVNAAALNREFVVHSGNGHSVNQCGAGSSFKGRNETTGWVDLPAWLEGDNGTVTGPTGALVRAIDGCDAVRTDGCVLFLPIATHGNGHGNDHNLYGVMWLPFRIYQRTGNVKHSGVLLGPGWVVQEDPTTPKDLWVRATPGPTSVRTAR